jgi:hypothetical protein
VRGIVAPSCTPANPLCPVAVAVAAAAARGSGLRKRVLVGAASLDPAQLSSWPWVLALRSEIKRACHACVLRGAGTGCRLLRQPPSRPNLPRGPARARTNTLVGGGGGYCLMPNADALPRFIAEVQNAGFRLGYICGEYLPRHLHLLLLLFFFSPTAMGSSDLMEVGE